MRLFMARVQQKIILIFVLLNCKLRKQYFTLECIIVLSLFQTQALISFILKYIALDSLQPRLIATVMLKN